jgi:hypothetical protein
MASTRVHLPGDLLERLDRLAEYRRLRELVRWADWSEAAAWQFGVFKARLFARDRIIDDLDIAIGSIAVQLGARLATHTPGTSGKSRRSRSMTGGRRRLKLRTEWLLTDADKVEHGARGTNSYPPERVTRALAHSSSSGDRAELGLPE